MTDIDISPESVERLRTSMRIGHSSTVDAERMILALSAALTQSRAETAAAYEAADVAYFRNWSITGDMIRALATPGQSSALAAIESAAEARGMRKAMEVVQERTAFYAKKRDADETEIDMHLTLIHTVEAHEYAVAAILAAIPQGDA